MFLNLQKVLIMCRTTRLPKERERWLLMSKIVVESDKKSLSVGGFFRQKSGVLKNNNNNNMMSVSLS